MGNRRKLVRKFILGFAIVGIVISGISMVIGIHGFGESIKKQYNDTAYDIAETVVTMMEQEELAAYAELILKKDSGDPGSLQKVMESERYQEIRQQMNDLRTSMGANDIYVAVVDMEQLEESNAELEDWAPLHYLFDTFHNEEESYALGDTGPFNPNFILEVKTQMETYCRSSNYYISKSQYGYNTSAVLPVRMQNQNLPVLIGVEIPMATLQSAVMELSFHTLGSIVVAMSVIILLFVYYLYRTVILPIDIIAEETEAFGDSGTQLSKRLGMIRTGDELQGLAESVLKMEQGILDYVENITAVTAEKERISTELNVATEIQANMLPRIFPAFPDRKEFDIYASMTPAKEVGGDFYDFFLADEDHLVMVIGDVSGKGVPAALYMVIAKTLLKNQAGNQLSPAGILEEVNGQLCENNESDMFVTVWLGIMEISTGKVIAANAGHEYPALCQGEDKFRLLEDNHGFVLGGMEGSKYREYCFEIQEGGCLFVYTDGVPEAANAKNEMFGTDRMLDALNEEPYDCPQEIICRVQDRIDGFVRQAPQFDDLTMLVLVRHSV